MVKTQASIKLEYAKTSLSFLVPHALVLQPGAPWCFKPGAPWCFNVLVVQPGAPWSLKLARLGADILARPGASTCRALVLTFRRALVLQIGPLKTGAPWCLNAQTEHKRLKWTLKSFNKIL